MRLLVYQSNIFYGTAIATCILDAEKATQSGLIKTIFYSSMPVRDCGTATNQNYLREVMIT